MEMRNLPPIVKLRSLFSHSGLLYRMDRKSDFLTFFGVKSIDEFFSGIQGCDELRLFVNILVSIIFHVTVRFIF